MKKVSFSKILIYAIISSCFFISCTKKSSKSRCEPITGAYDYNHYLFWINHDVQSIVTVEVKDDDGKVINTFYPQISVYYSTGQPSSCGEENNARFDLDYGRDYTYTAKTSTGLSWNGTIQTPCNVGQCDFIQLK